MTGYSDRDGYFILTGQQGHPVARRNGELPLHRKALYERIGEGPHYCHWGCGRQLWWLGVPRGQTICADHLDGDIANNDPDNLVASCFKCNWDRAHTTEGRARVFGPPYRNNTTSGVRGVSWEQRRRKWKVVVRKQWVGYFDDLQEAEAAAVARRSLEGAE